jgi:putative SOS response-associated peptidase YedK
VCGRFTLRIWNLAFLLEVLGDVQAAPAEIAWQPRFNVCPGNQHPVIFAFDGTGRVIPARWGWENHGRAPVINARFESAPDKPLFRQAWKEGRCLIPVDGFYEWTGTAGQKRPFFFHFPDHRCFFLAGLGRPMGAAVSAEFVILTGPADATVGPVHHRMPVILAPDQAHDWLRGVKTPGVMPENAPLGLCSLEVGRRVNSTSHDDPDCLQPVQSSAGPRQLTFPTG